MPAKKSAKKATAKKAAANRTTTTTPARKAPAAKAVRKSAAKEETGKSGRESARPKASELIKKSSHTPAIFKTGSKRPAHILFTLDEVREVLRKRTEEEKPAASNSLEKKQNNSKIAVKMVEVTDDRIQKSKHQPASLDDILGISSSSGNAHPGAARVPKKFAKYHRLLIELRDHVREELSLHSNDTLKRSQKEDAGDISISVDAGTDNFDRDFALSMLSSEQESLKEIEAAISRIYSGTYGICEVTGEPIDPERLEAVPFTRFSLEGQRDHEMNSRKRVSRTGAFLNEGSGDPISFGDDDDNN